MTDTAPISIAFAKIAELADRMSIQSIGGLPGLWIYQVDPCWTIVVNGHDQKANYQGMTVEPYHCLALHTGWPVGHFTPFGGWMAEGDEYLLIDVLNRALSKKD
jgi:hypothetical protein